MGTIKENVEHLHAAIRETAQRVGRDASDVTLLVVTKNRTVDQIQQLLECGEFLLGETPVMLEFIFTSPSFDADTTSNPSG